MFGYFTYVIKVEKVVQVYIDTEQLLQHNSRSHLKCDMALYYFSAGCGGQTDTGWNSCLSDFIQRYSNMIAHHNLCEFPVQAN